MHSSRFARFSWFVLAMTLLVILWGAYVRASGSGAGCGSHWPTCNGEVIPHPKSVQTVIEFAHRISSGALFVLILGQLFWAWRLYPSWHRVRVGATVTTGLVITEGLVGAGLVLFELVAHNASLARAISIAVHLVNTFLLLAALTVTAWWASSGQPVALRKQGNPTGWLVVLVLVGALCLGVTGAITALGDTLFPVTSLRAGLQQDTASTAHFLVRLRMVHPVLAFLLGGLLPVVTWVRTRQSSRYLPRLRIVLLVLFGSQLALGCLNIALLAPIWMQLVHLFMADLIWVTLVIFCAEAFAVLEATAHPFSAQTPADTANVSQKRG